MSDEGFREIQLNGKQLVFLFMAATVVSVVIFLCGVLVGRGVACRPCARLKSRPPTWVLTWVQRLRASAPETSPPPAASRRPASTPAASAGATTPPAEELSYAERLLRDTPPEEKLKQTPATPVKAASTRTCTSAAVQEPVAPKATPARDRPPRTGAASCDGSIHSVRSLRPRVCSPGSDLERSS